jgi:signal peptidase II
MRGMAVEATTIGPRPSANLGIAVAVVTAALDQASKQWLIHSSGIEEAGGRLRLGPFADLVYMRNPGISYSMLELKGEAGQWALTGIALVVSIGIVYWLTRAAGTLQALSLGLILGGAVGNAVDRPLMGGVIDFVSLHWGPWHWYVFNIADVAIVAGVLGLLYESLIGSRKKAVNEA